MSAPTYGRIHVPDPLSAIAKWLHVHDGSTPLREVDHEPPIGVLDQSDLIAQGIYTDQLVPGARRVDALGSCVYNANTAALSGVLAPAEFFTLTGAKGYADTVGLEKFSVLSYHAGSDQTGQPSQEWPPTDCGSSGTYAFEYDRAQDWVSAQRIAHGAQNIVSLLQGGAVMQGTPFFYSWEQPDASGFVDGNGTASDLEAAIRSGLAGGHETLISAIEKLTLDAGGAVVPQGTVLRVRNSWGSAWGDSGSFRLHLSTLVWLGGHCDFRRLVA